jgi:uncharacterized protein YbjT (DUF2867 family)
VILVVGATGLLGGEICKRLQAQGVPTRAFVRRGSPREDLVRSLGVEVVHGDLKDRDSVDVACRGCAGVDRDGSLTLLRAAERAGAAHFVFTSVSPTLPSNNPFVSYKREVEAAVRASSLTWTILQPSAYMEIHTGAVAGWDFARGRARLMGSGRAQASYVSVADVATFAVTSVAHPAAVNRTLHITGPQPLTGLEAVAIAERITGKTFTVQRLPTPALSLLRLCCRPFSATMSSLFAMGLGMQLDERGAIEALLTEFAIRPTTFEEYVRSTQSSSATSDQVS